LLARSRRVATRRVALDEVLERAARSRVIVSRPESLREIPEAVAGRVVPAVGRVSVMRTLQGCQAKADGRERSEARQEHPPDHSISIAGRAEGTSPSVGLEALAYLRRGMRPARKALRPARTASRIASAIRAGSLA
jgi:hypothetical protein